MSKRLIRSLAIAAAFSGGYFAVDAIQEPQEVHASSIQIDGYTYSAQVVEALNEINKYRIAVGVHNHTKLTHPYPNLLNHMQNT